MHQLGNVDSRTQQSDRLTLVANIVLYELDKESAVCLLFLVSLPRSNMSEVTTTLVPIPAPANPNLPDGVNVIPLHPISLILGFDLDCIWEFPGSLDRDRLIKAIQSTAILWPVVGGRLSHVAEGESLHEHDSRLGVSLVTMLSMA